MDSVEVLSRNKNLKKFMKMLDYDTTSEQVLEIIKYLSDFILAIKSNFSSQKHIRSMAIRERFMSKDKRLFKLFR